MLDAMWCLRRIPDRQEVFIGLILGQYAPRFQGGWDDTLYHIALAHDTVRLRHGPFQVPRTLAQAHGHVRPHGFMDNGRLVSRRGIGIKDWYERLIVHRN